MFWGFVLTERLPLVNADQPNTCAFEFSFFLPPGLPPSFVSPLGSSGYVSYDMELIRVEAGKEKTLNKTKIIVAPLLTFERMPSALVSMHNDESQDYY